MSSNDEAAGPSDTRNKTESTPLIKRASASSAAASGDVEVAETAYEGLPACKATAAPEIAGPASGSGEDIASVTSKVVIGLTMASSYICVSAAMIHFNKFLMRDDRFPFATFLTTLHMLGALVMSLLLQMAVPSLFPSWKLIVGDGTKAEGKPEDGLLPDFCPQLVSPVKTTHCRL
jgi:hypothetical protein